MYFTDRGIEELEKRRGEEEVTFEWLAEQLRTFVDLNPDFEVPVERLATWLARLDDEDDEEVGPRRRERVGVSRRRAAGRTRGRAPRGTSGASPRRSSLRCGAVRPTR